MSQPVNPSPSQTESRQPTSSTSPPQSLAFVVHSPDTVQNNLPPDVDNKPLARQKRRRTSKEDEEILRAEYEKNSKPDKATRLDIVSRVALGEKEVQIWFQNRRQNDRRKSRPQNDVPSSDRLDSSSDTQENVDMNNEDFDGDELKVQIDTPNEKESTAEAHTQEDSTASSSDKYNHPSSFTQLTDSQPIFSSQDSQLPANQSSGYIANRRSASFVKIYEDPSSPKPTLDLIKANDKPESRILKRSRSSIRLSLTADGNAKVVTDADQSPSPERAQFINDAPLARTGSLRRSYSAAGLHDQFQDASSRSPVPKLMKTASSHGRSRDSRTWEFWCDSDARNSLAEKADQEGSGSAADAIGLIRANSRGPLRSTPSKRNMMLTKQSSARVLKADGLKPGRRILARSSTSQARLQTQPMKSDLPKIKSKKTTDDPEEFETLNTESDKENWEPDDTPTSLASTGSRRNDSLASGRRPLGENTSIMSQSSSLGSMLRRDRSTKSQLVNQNVDTENVAPEDDEEIARFMGSARAGSGGPSSVSSGEEMCVEGLIKLSQANWR